MKTISHTRTPKQKALDALTELADALMGKVGDKLWTPEQKAAYHLAVRRINAAIKQAAA